MSKHAWVLMNTYELWELGASVGTLCVNLRCANCGSEAQFTANGLRACSGTHDYVFYEWPALHSEESDS